MKEFIRSLRTEKIVEKVELQSLFSRGRREIVEPSAVAPRVGAWIETLWLVLDILAIYGRSPRGSVD